MQGESTMPKEMTMEEMESQFDSVWILIDEPNQFTVPPQTTKAAVQTRVDSSIFQEWA